MKRLKISFKNILLLFIHAVPQVAILILVALGFKADMTVKETQLIVFVTAGFLSGIYHGYFHHVLWRKSNKDKSWQFKQNEETEVLGEFENTQIPYRINLLWRHIVCGLIGAVSLYFLRNNIDIGNPSETVKNLGLTDFALFVIATTALFGLLPRTIWYFSYGAQLKKPAD